MLHNEYYENQTTKSQKENSAAKLISVKLTKRKIISTKQL